MNDLETNFANLRLDNNYTQQDIANILNVKEDTYSKWERHINDLSLEKCNELANFYHVSIDYLMCLNNKNIKTDRNTIDRKILSERLLKLRKEKKLSQEALAKEIGFHQRTYAHYENGSRPITTFKLYYIATYHKVSLDYLVGRSDTK